MMFDSVCVEQQQNLSWYCDEAAWQVRHMTGVFRPVTIGRWFLWSHSCRRGSLCDASAVWHFSLRQSLAEMEKMVCERNFNKDNKNDEVINVHQFVFIYWVLYRIVDNKQQVFCLISSETCPQVTIQTKWKKNTEWENWKVEKEISLHLIVHAVFLSGPPSSWHHTT